MSNELLSNAYVESVSIAPAYTTSLNQLVNSLAESAFIQNAIPNVVNDSMTDDQIKERLESLVKDFTQLVDLIGKRGLQNKQWCLDGLDEMNKQSVRY